MPGYVQPKRYYQTVENFHVHQQAKNQLHPPRFSGDIAKILETCYFGYFEHAWLRTAKVLLSTCTKLPC